MVVAHPLKFIHISTCGHNDDSDIKGYKCGWDSLEVMRLQNESIDDLKERAHGVFIENDTRNTSIFILRCMYKAWVSIDARGLASEL